MKAPQDDPQLFDHESIRVTPSWFTYQGTSYAMRTVVRLALVERRVSRGPWIGLFCFSLGLILFAAYSFGREGMPGWLALLLFAGSISLALAAAYFAFVVRDGQRLEVVLDDGTRLAIERHGRVVLTRLHDALLRAMDWHHGADGIHQERSRGS